jgi:16S rRNA (cytosine967-C5)-methyltransferase
VRERTIVLEREAEGFNFSIDLMEILFQLYGSDMLKVAKAMKRPYKRYYFRANTIKASIKEIISSLRKQGLEVFQSTYISEALYTEVEGPFDISIHEKRIIVDRQTAESVLQGAYVYAPGIKSCKKLRCGESVTVVDELGQPVGSGRAVMSEKQILTHRKGLAVEITEHIYRVPCLRELKEYRAGLIYPQSFPAMLTTRALNPKPGMVVADLNCSPGGKLSHICQLTENRAKVYGMDRSRKKIERTRETIGRLGCNNITLSIQDTRYVEIDHPNLKVDLCIVDPPCTALGVTPKSQSNITQKKVRALADYQIQFLKSASRLLKPGGKLAYSVCTFTLEECERVALHAQDLGLQLIDQKPFVGCEGIKGTLSEYSLVQRFHPHIHGTGYFIALFEKSPVDH